VDIGRFYGRKQGGEMKPCKTCKGKGWSFQKATIFTGKYDRMFGLEIPCTTSGMEKVTCGKCFGKGSK
jgi:hypothetical protein